MNKLLISLISVAVAALMVVGMVIVFTPDNHVHEYTAEVERAATCTSNGKMVYTCSCGNNYAEKIDALGHSFVNYLSDGNATCTADGTLTAKCDRCEATDTKADAGSMLDHTYDAYANNGDDHTKSCDCGANITEPHIWEETERVYPTHTEEGSADYACACGATKHETLDMLIGCEYNQEVEEYQYVKSNATCTEAAVYYKSCVCGEFSDAEDAPTFVVGEPNGHSNDPWTLDSVDAQAQTAVLTYNCWDCHEDVTLNITFADCEKSGTPATCEVDGNETVTYVYYIGADEHELVVYSGTITKLGHAYGTPAYTWSEDLSSCTATTTCANDASHVVTETVVVTANVIAPNCYVEGKTVNTAVFTNELFGTQTKDTDVTAVVAAHTWDGTTCTICNATKFEAETFEVIGMATTKAMFGNEGKGAEATNYPSGDAFIYNLQYAPNSITKFTVTSATAQKAILSICMACREYEVALSEMFTLKVNGVEVSFNANTSYPIYTNVKYYDWIEVDAATIDLVAGENVIEFVRLDNDRGLNFDYVAVYGVDGGEVSDPREVNGHSYEWTFVTRPDYATAGSVYGYCKYCREYVDVIDLPVISEANGYTKLSSGVVTAWEYSYDGYKVPVDMVEDYTKYTFDVSATDDVFTSVVDGKLADGKYNTSMMKNSYGYFYELTQSATFTVEVTVDEAAEVVFILRLRSTVNTTRNYQDVLRGVSVTNGGQTEAVAVRNDFVSFLGWNPEHTVDAEVAVLSLKPGKNVITFTMGVNNINIAGVAFGATTTVKHDPVTVYGGTINTFDPFYGEVDVDNDTTANKVHGLVNAGTDNALYQNLRNSVLSFKVTVDEATTIKLRLGLAFNKSAGYKTTAIATITSTNANGANNVISTNNTAKNTQWAVAGATIVEFATIELAAGENIITITMGGNNVNITGVYIASTNKITFGDD